MDFLKDLSIDKIRNAAEDAYNQAKPKTDIEARVYEVLSHKNWGSSSTIMNEIARDTYDYERYSIVSKLMWEAMENQRPAAWRVVFKGLTLLEHLVKNGSERCVDDARNHSHVLRSLQNFNYYEGTIDRGLGVREKSKQIIEILGDDDRIREERQKARKLREKFGGNLGGVSSGGYSGGYANDSWSGGGGGSGGYGEGGIGSSQMRSGGAGYGGDSRSYDDNGGYSGRYDESRKSPAPAASATPTFATLPPEDAPKKSTKPKKTKKKKKAQTEDAVAAVPAAPAPAPEVDLFSFDTPAAAPASAATNADEFDAFQTAGGAPAAAASSTPTPGAADPFDAFGAMRSQPAGATTSAAQFDAFGGQSSATSQASNFGANNMFGNAAPAMQPNPMMGMQQAAMQQPNNTAVMGGAGAPDNNANTQDDDDFGDFEDAAAPAAAKSASADPLSKLISLDGLKKNPTKESKIDEPIIANEAAAQFVKQQKQQGESAAFANKNAHTAMSFAGIDGLHKTPTNLVMPQPVAGANANVMGTGGAGNANLIGMLDPNTMGSPGQQRKLNPMAANAQAGMMGAQMMANQGMMGNQAMMGGQGMMANQQAMMGNPAMMGGQGMMANQAMMGNQAAMMGGQGMMGNRAMMGNPAMMGGQGMMGNQAMMGNAQGTMNQQGMMMNNPMMGGMGGQQGGAGAMGGQAMGGQQMGGQPMGGWG